jgi:hypothetical protein
MTTQPEALRLAGELEDAGKPTFITDAAAVELRRLYAENENLRSVMVAAAEEIHEHWDAHCDEEGYGPANLMHRLENGIPAEYGYKAGDFARLAAANQELLEALKAYGSHTGNCDYLMLLTSMPPQRKPCSCGLHAIIAKHGKQK